MALDRTEFLISEVRQKTNNIQWDEESGIHDNEIIGYLNDAQTHLQETISNHGYMVFEETYETTIVANQEFYSLPDDAFTSNRIRTVSFSQTNRVDDWSQLSPTTMSNRDGTRSSYPDGYIPGNGGIYFVGVPQYARGSVRIVYERALDKMDKRRGKVASCESSAGVIEAVVLEQDTWLDEIYIPQADYFCVNDSTGTVKVYNAPMALYDSALATISTSLASSYIPQAGDYVTLGKYSTTHSKLPNNCRRYLTMYAQVAMQDRDTLDVPVSQNARLIQMENSLIQTFSLLDKNARYLSVDDYWFS